MSAAIVHVYSFEGAAGYLGKYCVYGHLVKYSIRALCRVVVNGPVRGRLNPVLLPFYPEHDRTEICFTGPHAADHSESAVWELQSAVQFDCNQSGNQQFAVQFNSNHTGNWQFAVQTYSAG